MSQKLSYDYMIIDPVIIGFSPNEGIIHLNICDTSIITLVKKSVYCLNIFGKIVIEISNGVINHLRNNCFQEDGFKKSTFQ